MRCARSWPGMKPHNETLLPMPLKLSEPQELLVNKLKGGAQLRHQLDTGLFRLQDGSKSRTVHPATVESLIRAGVISKSMSGDCRLETTALP